MNEQEKRDTVIKGLEEVTHFIKFDNLPAHTLKALLVIDDAIALLKAQEPRVMTLDEVKAIKCCWIEDEDAGIVYPAIYECRGNPSKKGQYAVFVIKPDSDVLPEDCDDDIVDEFEDGNRWLWEANINRTWRPWTSCPTDEQREAVK